MKKSMYNCCVGSGGVLCNRQCQLFCSNSDVEVSARILMQHVDYQVNILQSLPPTLSGTLIAHMNRLNYTMEMLAETSLVCERTIRRIRKEESYGPTLYTLIAICIGLNLSPSLSFDLLGKGGYTFRYTHEHITYRILLSVHYSKTIYECNDILQLSKMNRLGGK